MSTTLLTHKHIQWTNIVHPTQADIDQLGALHPHFHPLNLQDCLSDLEYPKLDHKDSYLFLVVQMPFWHEEEHSYRPAEVDIFIAHGLLVTVHRDELARLDEIFTTLQSDKDQRDEWMGRGASPLLYHLLNALVNDCFPLVHALEVQIRGIEHDLFHNDTRKILRHMAEVRRSLIVIRRVLNTQREIIKELFKGNWSFIQEKLDPYWEDIGDHLAQLCYTLDQDAEVMQGLSDTVDTLASHRIDEVVSLLTVVTVITMPVTLLATIFGMNITMPYENHPLLFFAILIVGLGLTVGLVWFLRSKKWL